MSHREKMWHTKTSCPNMIRCRKQDPMARTHELHQNSFQIGLQGAIIEGQNENKFACILHISLLNNINFHRQPTRLRTHLWSVLFIK